MKNAHPQQTKPAAQQRQGKTRPENKDNLDSREGEEQEFKGDDITHNKKDTQGQAKQQKEKA